MEFGSFDGEWDGKHNGVGFVEISHIFATQDVFCFESIPFESLALPISVFECYR